MKIKVSEATNLQLDWMVATAEGYKDLTYWPATGSVTSTQPNKLQVLHDYTDNWARGGPIIDREKIEFRNKGHLASYSDGPTFYGDTHLIAAMRCFVVSKLGSEVEMPEELS